VLALAVSGYSTHASTALPILGELPSKIAHKNFNGSFSPQWLGTLIMLRRFLVTYLPSLIPNIYFWQVFVCTQCPSSGVPIFGYLYYQTVILMGCGCVM
jgi:hypothetical protein